MAFQLSRSILWVVLCSFATINCSRNPEPTSEPVAVSKDQSLTKLGNQYAKDGLLREAAEMYRKALAKNPSNMVALRNLGMVQVRTGEYKNAIRNLEKAIVKFPADFDANYHLAEAYRGEDRFADAIFRYQIALKQQPNNRKALKALSWSYFKIRFFSEGLASVQKFRVAHPEDEQGDIIAARILIKLKREKEALHILQESAHGKKEEFAPYFESVKGDAYLSMNDLRSAETSYRAALKAEPLLAGALFGLGKILVSQNQVDQGIDFMERASRIMPKLTEVYFYLGKAYATKDPKKSKANYLKFAKEAANDPELLALVSEAKNAVAVYKPK